MKEAKHVYKIHVSGLLDKGILGVEWDHLAFGDDIPKDRAAKE